MKRLTIELQVKRSATLEHLVEAIGVQPSAGDHHLTLIHLGRPDELYRELVRASPLIPAAGAFLACLRDRTEETVTRFADVPAHSARVVRLVELGPEDSRVLAAELRLSAELVAYRERMLDSWRTWLAELGLGDKVDHFMETSSALGFTGKEWLPHVSLGPARGAAPYQGGAGVAVRLGHLRARNLDALCGAIAAAPHPA